MGLKPIIDGQFNRIEPEFSLVITNFYMHMRRFTIFIAKKGEPITTLSKNCGHNADYYYNLLYGNHNGK